MKRTINTLRYSLIVIPLLACLFVSAQPTNNLTTDPADGLYQSNAVIIRFSADATSQDTAALTAFLASEYGGYLRAVCYCNPILALYEFPGGVDIETVRQVASNAVGVEGTNRNYYLVESLNNMTDCTDPGEYITEIVAQNPGRRVKVGVLDTGFDPLDPDQSDYTENSPGETPCLNGDPYGYNFFMSTNDLTDNDDHGTAVNSIITNGQPSESIELINGKFFDSYGELFHVLCGIHYLIDRDVDIINLSLGYIAAQASYDLWLALLKAQQNDILVITSAGNDARKIDFIKWPASFTPFLSNLISVTAYEKCHPILYNLAPYANTGFTIQLAAPGSLEAMDAAGSTSLFNGTSFSAAYLTRIAATLMAENPELSALDAKNCILRNSQFVLGIPYRIPNVERILSCPGTKKKKHKHWYALENPTDQEAANAPYVMTGRGIQLLGSSAFTDYLVTDIAGRVISQGPVTNRNQEIFLPQAHSIYFLNLQSIEGPKTHKIYYAGYP